MGWNWPKIPVPYLQIRTGKAIILDATGDGYRFICWQAYFGKHINNCLIMMERGTFDQELFYKEETGNGYAS